MTITLLLIATNKYKEFVPPLLDGVRKHFFKEHDVNVVLFTDEPHYFDDIRTPEVRGRLNIGVIQIPAYRFPDATLRRYEIFTKHRQDIQGDYVFYSDVDMAFVGDVGEEILFHGLVATHHPSYFKDLNTWGSRNVDPKSNAYLKPHLQYNYAAGGFQGGMRNAYLTACWVLSERILDDERRGVQAEWHDETHWNWYLKQQDQSTIKYLTPSYCMAHQETTRQRWGIDHLEVKIIALDKDHAKIRA